MKPVWLMGFCLIPGAAFLCLEFAFASPRDQFAGTQLFLRAGCFVFGFLRLSTFHPLYRPAYFKWLVSTSWSSRRPLPFGSINFRPIDLIIVAPMLIGMVVGSGPVQPLLYAVGGYVAAVAITLDQSCNKRALRIVLFLSGLVLVASVNEWMAAMAMLTLLLVSLYSQRRVLAKLPRLKPIHNITSNHRGRVVRIGRLSEGESRRIGFPFDQTSPVVRNPLLRAFDAPRFESLVRSLLIGWLVFCVCYRIGLGIGYQDWTLDNRLAISGIGMVMAMMLGVLRLACYLTRHRSPLGPISRLLRRQPVIPGYDVVFVGPLMTVVVTMLLGLLTTRIGVHPSVVVGIMATVSLFCTLTLRPGYEQWHFTGGHRLDPRFGP